MRPLPLYLLLQQRRQRRLEHHHRFDLRLGQAVWIAGAVMGLGLAVGILLLAWFYSDLTNNLPPVTRLPTLLNPNDGLLLQPTRLYDHSGQHLLLTLIDPGSERKYLGIDPAKPDHFSPFLIQATIGVEEPGFWQSTGISWQNLTHPEAVTIAEQVVDHLLLPDEPRDLRRALRMRLLAAQLVSRYGRAQVLEWHLNSAYYGKLAYGAESAARLYLGKSAADLNLAEAALLAPVHMAPALNPLDVSQAALERQRMVLDQLLANGLINQDLYEGALRSKLALRPSQPGSSPVAPAYTNLVLEQLARRFGRSRLELGGLQITTSLDFDLQIQLVCTLQAQLARSEGAPLQPGPACETSRLLPALPTNFRPLPPGLSGSAVLLDLTNGQVLALTGDSTSVREANTSAGHNPGTLLTPFLAVSAFSRGFGPASLVWDIPGQLSTSLDLLTHPDGKYSGPLRLRQALANDILAPLQQLLIQIGPANVWRLAEPLGLSGLGQTADPSQLLFNGGSTRLLEIAQAYSTIANLGTLVGQRSGPGARLEPVSLLRVEDIQGRVLFESGDPDSQPVLSPALAYLVHNNLSDEPARWPSLGYPNLLEIGRPAGAKMGRTSDGRQVWTAGYTPQRLVVTQINLPSDANPALGLDVRLAAGLWHALIQSVVRDLPANNWTMPLGITKMEVCSPSGLLPTRVCPNIVNEWFLNGTEPTGLDTLYRTFQINRESKLLATVFTPPELVEERTYLMLPEEAQAWGKLAGLPVPPSSYDHIQPPTNLADVKITSPAHFGVVSGKIAIRGTAAGDNFSYYQLQVGEGLNPATWLPVGELSKQAVKEGTLGIWDTSKLNGLYALRLQVVRQDQRLETAILQVTVDNAPPQARILTPFDGQKIAYGSQPVTFQVEANDIVGLSRVEFLVDGVLENTRTVAPYTITWAPHFGPHTLKVIAYDLAGNSSEAKIEFRVE
jgi:membrane peptidoglycan carboxypeptidase